MHEEAEEGSSESALGGSVGRSVGEIVELWVGFTSHVTVVYLGSMKAEIFLGNGDCSQSVHAGD